MDNTDTEHSDAVHSYARQLFCHWLTETYSVICSDGSWHHLKWKQVALLGNYYWPWSSRPLVWGGWKSPATRCDIEKWWIVGVVLREHNIYGVPCKDLHCLNTKSNPGPNTNTNSLFLHHIQSLVTFILASLFVWIFSARNVVVGYADDYRDRAGASTSPVVWWLSVQPSNVTTVCVDTHKIMALMHGSCMYTVKRIFQYSPNYSYSQ